MTGRHEFRISERAPLLTFAGVEAAAAVLYLVLGRAMWFYNDEWDFIVTRKASNLGDLFRPHNEHWQTLPILAFRGLYSVFALHTYVPYQLLAVLLHLTVGALLLLVMRRARVQPWIATAAASAFVLFGTGITNITRAFQIGFTGALAFGLVHLVLTDHDGPVDRRDWFGLLAGLLGLMTSGVAVALTIIVGLSVLARRGRRLALFHTAPLAACYVLWFAIIGHEGYTRGTPSARALAQFVETGLRNTYRRLGVVAGIGALLAVVLIAGAILAYLRRRRSGTQSQLIVPAALLAGSVIFLAISAFGRVASFGPHYALQPRYTYVVAVLTLPALALAADALAGGRRWLVPLAATLFLVGIPGNVRSGERSQHNARLLDRQTREMMVSIPLDPRVHEVPRSLQPETTFSPQVTVGWVLDEAAQHKLPGPGRLAPSVVAATRFRLSFDRSHAVAPPARCRELVRPTRIVVEPGEIIGVYDNPMIVQPARGGLLVPVVFNPRDGSVVTVIGDPGALVIGPRPTFGAPRVCLPPPAGSPTP